ncbi:MAG: HDOD domain-containing protein [Desulfobacterales bacterium]|nr:MAG: HDOD domain-containing protein [Desulfobacterales bacterium]
MPIENIPTLVKSFPSIPGSAAQLLALVDDPGMSVAQIEDILRYDPGLTANVLKLANSAYFGIPSKVGSIRRAVILLGLKRLIQIVIASCVSGLMDRPVPGYGLPPGELWRHSIAVSVAAEGLLKELRVETAEEIFTAALLHDVGKLILGGFVDDDYQKIDQALSPEISFEAAEHMVLGTDHAAIGAQILTEWSFPPEIVTAVRWHHDPEGADETNTGIDIVHVANVLCLMMGIGVGREGLHYMLSEKVTARLALEPVHLEKVASQTLQWVAEISALFGSQ